MDRDPDEDEGRRVVRGILVGGALAAIAWAGIWWVWVR